MAKCCICEANIEREDAAVLGMGGAGNARLLCDGCDKLLETATRGRDYDEISRAISEISDRISHSNPDNVTYTTLSDIIHDASNRAKAIKEGSYDFDLDEEAEEGFDEIPEELLETEEDIAKDKADEEKMKKFDKVYNVFLIGACIAFAGFLIWKIVDTFFLK